MAPADSHRVSRVPCYSGAEPVLSGFRIQGCHLLWPTFPDRSTNPIRTLCSVLQPRRSEDLRFGLFPFRSPLLRESSFLSFLLLLRCFSSQAYLPYLNRIAPLGIRVTGD